MYILVDDPDRENEGDLIIPGQYANPEAINFMAKFGRGLICLAMTKDRIQQLGLQFMNPNNQKNDLTAFTVSIEAKEGVTTGISAADRAHTISVAINNNKNKDAVKICEKSVKGLDSICDLITTFLNVLRSTHHTTESSVDVTVAALGALYMSCGVRYAKKYV